MFYPRTRLFMLALSVAALVASCLTTGCAQRPDANPAGADAIAATPAPTATVNFSVQIDPPSANPGATIRAATGVQVTFTLVTINTSDPNRSTTTQVQTVNTTTGGSATAAFTNVPIQPCLAYIWVEGGTISTFSRFHGAADLVAGNNTVIVQPVGSKFSRDVEAQALIDVLNNATTRTHINQGVVATTRALVAGLSRQSTTVYSTAAAQLAQQLGAAGTTPTAGTSLLAVSQVKAQINGVATLLNSTDYTPGVPYSAATFTVTFNSPLAAVPTNFTVKVRNEDAGSTTTLTATSGISHMSIDGPGTTLTIMVGSGRLAINKRYTITLQGGVIQPQTGPTTAMSAAYRFQTGLN